MNEACSHKQEDSTRLQNVVNLVQQGGSVFDSGHSTATVDDVEAILEVTEAVVDVVLFEPAI